MKPFVLFLLLLLPTASAWAQALYAPPANKPRVAAAFTATPPVIDGKLDEAAWASATSAGRFTQQDPDQGAPVHFATDVRLLYDARGLYLAAICHDTIKRHQLRAPDLRRDFTLFDHDFLLICLDGFRDERNAMTFAINPYGAQRDVLIFDATLADVEWDGLWQVRTQRTDSGWVAECAIPWETLRYAPKPATGDYAWGLNITRLRRASNEKSTWAPVPRALSPVRMDYAGLLTGLNPPAPGLNLRVQPFALAAAEKGADGSRRSSVKVGGEVKWALTPETVLDLTVNTDFAQADADRKINNLSRFSVLFPERRQFFLENASLFSPGLTPRASSLRIMPFFSRAIGLNADGQPLPFDGGARLVHRSATRNFGALLVRQRATDAEPANMYYVGRYSQNVGAQHKIGGLLTVRQQGPGADEVTPGYTSFTGAADGFFRLGTKVSLSTMASATGASRSGLRGVAAYSDLRYDANHLSMWWAEAVVTRQYSPESGFVGRRDVVATLPGFYLILRGKSWLPGWLRSYEPGIHNEYYHQASTGRLLESSNRFFLFDGITQRGGSLRYYLNRVYQQLDEPFRPLGLVIAPGRYTYYSHNVEASSDASRRLSYAAVLSSGGYYNGWLNSVSLTVKLAPNPHFFLQPSYLLNDFRGVGTETTTRRVALYGLESRLALNPRVQLSGFYQRNSIDASQVVNLRFAWEYRPLSFLYLVLNEQGYRSTTGEPVTERGLIGKVSYLKQF
ncbi:carbohydrate binding family 9 domain-containing protein [Hymenobacter terrenus]|uniref:carbohydrate binding family 9 domain-containing protein n=1 Tax=Hymenobacter terrenus TaxID=1629124 RepID=UPI0006193C17|nr:carbohydrate binding family 9 domain-containing protein [Hymenobacter terrenus]